MRLESDEAIAQLLLQAKRIALVGASAKPERPSHRVMQFLLDEGYEVIPINPGLAGQKLLGQTVYASLADLPTSVDMADIFRDAASLPEVTQEVVDAGIPCGRCRPPSGGGPLPSDRDTATARRRATPLSPAAVLDALKDRSLLTATQSLPADQYRCRYLVKVEARDPILLFRQLLARGFLYCE
jgi:predicted CoA-binding protein